MDINSKSLDQNRSMNKMKWEVWIASCGAFCCGMASTARIASSVMSSEDWRCVSGVRRDGVCMHGCVLQGIRSCKGSLQNSTGGSGRSTAGWVLKWPLSVCRSVDTVCVCMKQVWRLLAFVLKFYGCSRSGVHANNPELGGRKMTKVCWDHVT